MAKSGRFNAAALESHSDWNFVAWGLQHHHEEPLWPLEDFCENTDSVSIVLGDPGNRTALLGNSAECTEHTIDDAGSAGAATVSITGYDTFAVNAADGDSIADSRYAAAAGSGSAAQQPDTGIRSTAITIRLYCR